MSNEQRKTKKINLMSLLFFSLLIFIGQTQLVLAESGGLSSVSSASAIGFWIFIFAICDTCKRRAIGGWLLFYYIKLFEEAVLVFISISLETSAENLNIANWGDETMRYFLYVISVVPANILLIAELIFGGMLLLKKFRNRKIFNFLKITLAVQFGFGLLAFIIDLNYWTENIMFDLLLMVGSAFWFLYFTFSKRTRLVFIKNKWNSDAIYPPERKNGKNKDGFDSLRKVKIQPESKSKKQKLENEIECPSCGEICDELDFCCKHCGEKFWQNREAYEKFLKSKKMLKTKNSQ